MKQKDCENSFCTQKIDINLCKKIINDTKNDIVRNFEISKLLKLAESIHMSYHKTQSPVFISIAAMVHSRKIILSNFHEHAKDLILKLSNKSGRVYRIYVYGDNFGTQHKLMMTRIKFNKINVDYDIEDFIDIDDIFNNKIMMHIVKISGSVHAVSKFVDYYSRKKFISKYY